MIISIASDHAGVALKADLSKQLQEWGHEVIDVGCHSGESVDYPDYASQACNKVLSNEAQRAILICGTGIGMSIAANKMPGIRCALVHDTFSAKATREHNDANVLALGERVIGPGLAADIVRLFVDTEFSQAERHRQRIGKVHALETCGTN